MNYAVQPDPLANDINSQDISCRAAELACKLNSTIDRINYNTDYMYSALSDVATALTDVSQLVDTMQILNSDMTVAKEEIDELQNDSTSVQTTVEQLVNLVNELQQDISDFLVAADVTRMLQSFNSFYAMAARDSAGVATSIKFCYNTNMPDGAAIYILDNAGFPLSNSTGTGPRTGLTNIHTVVDAAESSFSWTPNSAVEWSFVILDATGKQLTPIIDTAKYRKVS